MTRVFVLLAVLTGALCDNKDGGQGYRLPLNDGNSIPAIGLGTFLGFDQKGQVVPKEHEVENSVKWALEAGYRMIDTAALYDDEDQVGDGVRASGVPREDVFIVTKLPTNNQRDVLGSLRGSLDRLKMSYVDLYLIHFPIAFKPNSKEYDIVDYVDTWKQMEQAKELGLAKSIGISNFNVSQIERLLENSKMKPAVLQVEVNLNLAQQKLIDFCKANDIVVMAYSPFGSLFSKKSEPPAPRSDDPALVEIAKKYGKTTPQVVLRYLIQRGVIPIPKSVKKNRVEENLDVFNFELSQDDIETLNKFNKDYRIVHPTYWQDHPYYPFEKVDKVGPNPFEGEI